MTRLLFLVVVAFAGWITLESASTMRRTRDRAARESARVEAAERDSVGALEAYEGLRAARGVRRRPGDVGATPDWVLRARAAGLGTPAAPPVRDSAADAERVRRYGAYTYLEAVAAQNGGRLRRWAPRAEPLRVWVQGDPRLAGWSAAHSDVVRGALRTWDEAKLPFRVVRTEDSTAADIYVLWARRFPGGSSRIGETGVIWTEDGWIQLATITVALESSGGLPLDIYAVQNVARHELGHAIGLDHSPQPEDLMAASEAGQPSLTERDVNTARLLYGISPGAYPVPITMSTRDAAAAELGVDPRRLPPSMRPRMQPR